MKSEIPSDPGMYGKIVQIASLRYQSSKEYYQGKRDQMRVCYERWSRYPARPTVASDQDDYEIQLGYGFGLVEQVISKITEPLMNMGIPFGVFPTEMGDQPRADNFADMCRDFYSKPHVQSGKRKSKKEMGITGSRVEIDEWLHIVENGSKWGKAPKVVQVQIPGAEPGVMAENTEMVDGECPCDVTTHYGFNTRYPSVFDIYPEPGRTTIDAGQNTDISWLIEDLGELAVEDMVKQVIYDPETKTTKPRYDFKKLIEDQGAEAKKRYANILSGASSDLIADSLGPVITPINAWDGISDSSDSRDGSQSRNAASSAQSFEDRDKIRAFQMRTKNEIVTIAQGKYIIERILKPWHRPRIGVRIECYTIDPRSIWGLGVLDPINDELDELDITHSLGMQNLFRLVNKMVAVKTKALVSQDDLDPRAGGIIRINDEVESASQAIYAVQTPNAIQEMLSGESVIKGNVEFVSSNLDGSPGVMGTKQNHKTARGMEIIQINLSTRFATMQAQGLINEALSGQSMLYFTEQFMWEPKSYSRLRDDGATVFAKFTKDDIDTGGRGLNFLITVDPLWGNTQAQRQDAQSLFGLGIEYEKLRLEMNDPTMPKMVLAELASDLIKKHGRRDLSKIFVMPNGEISPDQELQVLMQGGVVDGCRGDLRAHMKRHIFQAKSPMLAKAIEAGKADPETAQNLIRLVKQAQAELATFIQDPETAAEKDIEKLGAARPGAEQ